MTPSRYRASCGSCSRPGRCFCRWCATSPAESNGRFSSTFSGTGTRRTRMTDVVRAFVILALLVAFVALARGDDLPDPELTPGAVRTDITLVDICTRKWGTDVR